MRLPILTLVLLLTLGSSVSGQDSGNTSWRADRMARTGVMRHYGGALTPGARFEGVGYSSSSPKAALTACCYWGRRKVIAYSVRRGRRGYFAVAHYR